MDSTSLRILTGERAAFLTCVDLDTLLYVGVRNNKTLTLVFKSGTERKYKVTKKICALSGTVDRFFVHWTDYLTVKDIPIFEWRTGSGDRFAIPLVDCTLCDVTEDGTCLTIRWICGKLTLKRKGKYKCKIFFNGKLFNTSQKITKLSELWQVFGDHWIAILSKSRAAALAV